MVRKLRNRKGITLAEVLIVVAIIAVIAGVSFVAVINYTRSMTKLEYDGYAKEIFVAAQNHLASADSMDYLGMTSGFGTAETVENAGTDNYEKGVYFFVVNTKEGSNAYVSSEPTVLDLMLPFASVDDTIRLGKSYIIRYHKDSAQVLDVFCWSESEGRYTHEYDPDVDYQSFLSKRDKKKELRTYGSDRSVIGYFGGVEAGAVTHSDVVITAPSLMLVNAEKLYAVVTENNETPVISMDGYRIELIVTGVQSHSVKSLTVGPLTSGTSQKIVLDEITAAGSHFYDIFCKNNGFYPGEDITVKAKAWNSQEFTNVAYSSEQTANSLFSDDTVITRDPTNNVCTGTAKISNIRHLENLGESISKVDALNELRFPTAEQTTDIDWNEFTAAITANWSQDPNVYNAAGDAHTENSFMPADLREGVIYDGNSKSISNVVVNWAGNSGVFSRLYRSTVRNLKLVDFNITSTEVNAGALAGTVLNNARITNVLACGRDAQISGKLCAGGLVGEAENSEITECAASMNSVMGATAGGLVGSATGASTIKRSYSGGRTEKGEYYTHTLTGERKDPIYNVRGTVAGGLVGSFEGTQIEYCYSTCSVKGQNIAGGFAGSIGAARVDTCYSAGLIGESALRGAFFGKAVSTSASNCKFFETVNNTPEDDTSPVLIAVGQGTTTGIKALDEDKEAYTEFVGAPEDWTDAQPYDESLNLYYGGKYPLRSLERLGEGVAGYSVSGFVVTHWGDWPAPETFVVNR